MHRYCSFLFHLDYRSKLACFKGSAEAAHSSTCKCIIHHVFSGVLQSDVTCQKCHNITTTYDPILDFSLNIRQSSKSGKLGGKAKKKGLLGAVTNALVINPTPPVGDSAETTKDVAGDASDDKKKAKPKDDVCTLVECLER